MRSAQQKNLKLLELMDPSIRQLLGIKQIETGDFSWRSDMLPDLRSAIAKRIDIWVTKAIDPPFRYDPKIESDMKLWHMRRKIGILWVKSDAATNFGSHMYGVYAEIFSALIKDQGYMFCCHYPNPNPYPNT